MNFREYLQSTFKKEISDALLAALGEKAQNYCANIKSFTIKLIDMRSMLGFHDYVELRTGIEAYVSSYEDGTEYCRLVSFIGTISGSFSKRFSDFRYVCSEKSTQRKAWNRFKNPLSDDLIPKLTKKDYDWIALDLIHTAYPFYEETSDVGAVDPFKIAKALGVQIIFCKLRCPVRGAYIFFDSTVAIDGAMTKIPANTILINSTPETTREMQRFTVFHELVHAYLHRYHLYLKRIYNEKYSSISCLSFGNPKNEKDRILEGQADGIAGATILPRNTFTRFVNSTYENMFCVPDPERIKRTIDRTCEHFSASKAAVRNRMLANGYRGASGVYCYVDGKYIPDFAFEKGCLKAHQTFTLSKEQAKKVISKNTMILKLMKHHAVRFIENHFVINDPTYIKEDGSLTVYARRHLNKCALKFEEKCVNIDYSTRPLNNNVLFRVTNKQISIEALLCDDNTEVIRLAKELTLHDLDVLDITTELPRSFPKAVNKIIDWAELNDTEIESMTWLSVKTIGRLKSNDTTNHKIKTILCFCIGLQLPFEISIMLLEASGHSFAELATTKEGLAYLKILKSERNYSIPKCNHFLEIRGFQPLAVKNPNE